VKIGDLLLLKGVINKKQLNTALSKQAKEAINYSRSVPLGKVLIEMGHVTVDEISEVLNEQSKELRKEVKVKSKEIVMAHKIGENTAFQMDLKFLVTIMFVVVSAVGLYFTITGQVDDNKKEIDNIKSMGDIKIISYKMEEYSETFKDLKVLANTLSTFSVDVNSIKADINNLKNKKAPSIDLSGIDNCLDKLDKLSAKIGELQAMSSSNEDRLNKLEKRNSGGSRF